MKSWVPEPRNDAVEQIYGFRHPEVGTEVWFVALGSELAGNAGMNAFIEQHADDLKGAIVVELDGLGAGDLTLIEREGRISRSSPHRA